MHASRAHLLALAPRAVPRAALVLGPAAAAGAKSGAAAEREPLLLAGQPRQLHAQRRARGRQLLELRLDRRHEAAQEGALEALRHLQACAQCQRDM